MTVATLYLAAAFVAGLLAVLVRLPPLVGFLAAGFVLSGAGVEELPYLETLADLGVTLLLFGIGLKLDVRSLLKPEIWLTTVAHLAISVAVGIGFLALLGVAGFSLLSGAGLDGLALVAFALSFSSTVFVVKVLDERSDDKALYGRLAIGVLVMQDIAAVAFLTLSKGEPPSPWALALVLLIPAAWVFRQAWSRIGHGEMQAVFGLLMALGPGYLLFDAVGLKGDLGALVMGALLASHPAAGELGKTLFSVKELLLVGFFLSIGLTGVPTLEQAVLAVLLLLLVPVQVAAYVVMLRLMRLRHRTSLFAGLVLAQFSEFGLIVAAVGHTSGWLDADWVVVIALSVAISFALCAGLNRRGHQIVAALTARLPAEDPGRLHPEDRQIDVGQAEALVLGMGRVGRATFARLRDEYGLRVIGIEHDAARCEQLRADGLDVVNADATDAEFWHRVSHASQVRIAVLAMPFHGANLLALELLRSNDFEGRIAGIAQYDDEAAELERRGADAVFHLYGSAGTALADAVATGLADGR